ncbi:Calcium-binding component of the spindle pole body (SPB) half-bridge [Coemansia sp. BCRC 34301]|nr:Calcium-binding component of the spindle pole body (SPB) half-bridge [Coemansia sp. BCRC 34301]
MNSAYHQYSSLQRTAPVKPAPKVSDEVLEEIQEAFTLFDTNKDGFLDYFELKVAMRAVGFDMKKDEVLKILGRHGTDDGAKISTESFVNVMSEMVSKRDPVEEYRRAFKLIDENATGVITVANLRRIARELGENIADDELQAMVEEFDMDNDGAINEEEFIRIMVNGH